MSFQHQELARGRWQELSLMEQLGNIGSEVGRAAKWQGKDKEAFELAAKRAFELLDLTMQDRRWQRRLKEIARARELFSAALLNDDRYQTTLQDLERYFFQFALAARLNR